MATLQTVSSLGQPGQDFKLPGTDGRDHALSDIAGPNGTVVAFICNHCPYVKAVAPRMAAAARTLADAGVGFVAISSNDTVAYPQDSLEHMKAFHQQYDFGFPYLYDESQAVARSYDATCTPEFYGLNAAGVLVYHGRLDEGRTDQPAPDARRELVEAMLAVAAGGEAPQEQIPAVGCSIKWKDE